MMTGKKFTVFGLIAMAICLTMAMPAFGAAARANVPFAFEASNVSLPAGNYLLETSENGALLFLTSEDGSRNAVIVAPGGDMKRRSDGWLLFERVGSTYRLAEVRISGAPSVMNIPATHAQMLMAKNERPVRVTVAMVRK